MKRYLLALAAFAGGVLHAAAPASAQKPPEAALNDILAAVKQQGSLEAALDFVDWDTAYAQVPEKRRAYLKTASPEAFRDRQRQFFLDPESFVRKQLEEELSKLQGEKRKMLETQRDRIISSTVREMEEQKTVLRGTNYNVGAAAVEADTATVPISAENAGRRAEWKVPLVLKKETWMLPSLEALKLPPQFDKMPEGRSPGVQ